MYLPDCNRYMISQSLRQWLSGKESACQCRRHSSIPGLGRFLGRGNGNPLSFLDTLRPWLLRRKQQCKTLFPPFALFLPPPCCQTLFMVTGPEAPTGAMS